MEIENLYNNSIIQLNNILNNIQENLDIKKDFFATNTIESSLNTQDYCFTFLFGFLGAFISTNKALENYLKEIHNSASEQPGEYDKFQTLMGTLLHHKNDCMDTMKNRNFEDTYISFHRLLWGHDILSCNQDNPIYIMIKQKNHIILGILQVLRHLIADTMSKQGLPAPGTSFLDYINNDGKKSNYFIDIVNNLSIEVTGNKKLSQDIYSHLCTIRMQDITGGILDKTLLNIYFKSLKINNEIKKAQITFMVYAIHFFIEATIGSSRQNSVPYINIPIGILTFSSFINFYYQDHLESKHLEEKTNELSIITDKLTQEYLKQSELLYKYNSSDDFINTLENTDNNMNLLINFLGENDQ